MKNLKISNKLAISFALVLLISMLGNVYSISQLNKSAQLNKDLYSGPYEGTTQAMGVRRDLVSIGRNLTNIIFRDNYETYNSTALKEFESIDNRIDKIEISGIDDKQSLERLRESISSLKNQYDKIYNLVSQGNINEASKLTEKGTEYWSIYNKCVSDSIELYDHIELRGSIFYSDIQSTVRLSEVISIVINVVSVIVLIVISIYISKSFKKPIKELEFVANKMAIGDYEFEINYKSKDEFGILSDSIREVSVNTKSIIADIVRVLDAISKGNFNVEPEADYIGIFKSIEESIRKITIDLSETIDQINVASGEVELAAEQVASASQMLSQGATEQASAIEELSSTMINISEKTKNTAENANEANLLAISSTTQIEEGNYQINSMIKAMQEISLTSNEISRIIKTIDDIAFQTNILALNAAVEAARAGEAGKGFAVVADEVRTLAAKSAEAAKNTTTLIDNSIKAIDNGGNIVDNTAKSLESIIDITNRTIKLVDEIAKASQDQANSISQVTVGIDQISSVVQTNSATSEESAAASEELSGQAKILKSLIENFTVKK